MQAIQALLFQTVQWLPSERHVLGAFRLFRHRLRWSRVDDRGSIFRATASPASALTAATVTAFAAATHGYLIVQADARERGAVAQRRGATIHVMLALCSFLS